MERDIKPTYDELESYVENLQKQLADAQATIAALQDTIMQMGGQAAVLAKDAMAAKEQVAALQERVRTATQLIIAEIGASGPEDLEEAIGRIVARLTQHTSELEAAKAELEQERVRLASCLIAAEGGTKDIVKQGDYGWSPAYQATLNLQAELERVRAALEDACLSVAVHGEQPPQKWLDALQHSQGMEG